LVQSVAFSLGTWRRDERMEGLCRDPAARLGRLGRGRLAEVIVRPRVQGGLAFEDGLIDRVIEGREPRRGRAAAVAYTLRERYDRPSGLETDERPDHWSGRTLLPDAGLTAVPSGCGTLS
jgi:hypothetical protein